MDLSTAYSKVVSNVSKNSPAILTGFAVAGFVGTVVLAVKATPTALDLINAEKLDRKFKNIPENRMKKHYADVIYGDIFR